MTSLATVFTFGQIVVLAASLPLSVIAAVGYRRTPFGTVLLALPVIAAGFLVSATAEVLSPQSEGFAMAWGVGSVVAVLGVAWASVHLFVLLTGRRRLGR